MPYPSLRQRHLTAIFQLYVFSSPNRNSFKRRLIDIHIISNNTNIPIYVTQFGYYTKHYQFFSKLILNLHFIAKIKNKCCLSYLIFSILLGFIWSHLNITIWQLLTRSLSPYTEKIIWWFHLTTLISSFLVNLQGDALTLPRQKIWRMYPTILISYSFF